MWQFSNEHHRPSLIIESTSVALPIRGFTHARQKVRRIAHRLHAARDRDVDVSRGDALGREHHRLQSGSADLIDRQGGDVIVEPAVERGLPRGILTVPRLDDVAHDALIDARRIDPGARDGLAHGQRAKFGGCEVFQGAEKLSGGCAYC